MNKKTLITYGLVLVVIQTLLSCGIFVTFPQMTAYAASKDSIQQISEQLNRIEHKLDKVMGY
jgi:hypothetical protein